MSLSEFSTDLYASSNEPYETGFPSGKTFFAVPGVSAFSSLERLLSDLKKAGIKKILVHSHCTGNKNLKHALVKLIYGKIIQ